jgi:predicted nucleic acid-binding protein
LRVVFDTSPLILLAKTRRLDVLDRLYDEILIPNGVIREVRAKPAEEAAHIEALLSKPMVNVQVAAKDVLEGIPRDLGSGEREAIALGLDTEADLVVLDDQQGRIVGRRKGLVVTGTVGVLVEAKARNVISSLRDELDRLVEAGMWVSEGFYHRILKEFGE